MMLVFGLRGDFAPSTTAYGSVLRFSLRESDEGSFPLARVRVDDRDVVISLPRGTRCNIGDRIELSRRKALLGFGYRLGARACTMP